MKNAPLLTTVLLLFQIGLVRAQGDLYNAGVLHVAGGGGSLFIKGNFSNSGSASFTNNGDLFVLQDLYNDQPNMMAGSGTLHLRGGSAQKVEGIESFRTFNLITNNSSGILLNSNLAVGGVHSFITGIITTSSHSGSLTYEAGSSYHGASDNRHVNGWVKKIGATNFIFPVGSGTSLRSAQLSNLSSVSTFICRYNLLTPNTKNTLFPITNVDMYEYWDITRVNGGTAQVTLGWDHNKIPFPIKDMRVANYANGQWVDRGGFATSSVVTTGSITSSVVNSFGLFTFGDGRKGGRDGLYIVNNPVFQRINISATGIYIGNYDYSLFNAAGQLMQKGTIYANGNGITPIPFTVVMAPGVYVLDLRNSAHRLTERILVR